MPVPAASKAANSVAIAIAKEGEPSMRAFMHLKSTAIIIVLLGLGLASCGKLKDDLPAPTQSAAKIHKEGWNDTSSANFHGTLIRNAVLADSTCWNCHARSFDGGTSGKSCYTCHSSYPHLAGWNDTTSTSFHGKFLRLGTGQLSDCADCHGAGFDGGTSGRSCYACHTSYPHKAEWLDPAASGSHGKFLKEKSWQSAECAGCHGANFTGNGNPSMSCFKCHASYPHTVFVAASSHAAYLLSNGYPLDGCKTCHGSSYTGGSVVDISCSRSGCHVDNAGVTKSPEACNACHGQFRAPSTDALSAAPPKSVIGDSLTTKSGVGAHAKHLVSGSLGKLMKCVECHTVPTTLRAQGHIDTQLPAEVVFNDTLARLATGGGSYVPSPTYTPSTATCANTYCHGNWQMKKTGSGYAYIFTDSVMWGNIANDAAWTGGTSEASCSSCHGLPPTGHVTFPLNSCANCHTGVVNGSGNIINPALHVNGKANIFGQERRF